MTANNETRFRCDRCEDETILPIDSGGPAHGRMSGPSNWLMMRLGTDPSTPPQHLCEKCNVAFMQFMEKPSG